MAVVVESVIRGPCLELTGHHAVVTKRQRAMHIRTVAITSIFGGPMRHLLSRPSPPDMSTTLTLQEKVQVSHMMRVLTGGTIQQTHHDTHSPDHI